MENLIIQIILYIGVFILFFEVIIYRIFTILTTPKKLDFQLVNIDDIPAIDLKGFTRYTDSLEYLGFTRIADIHETKSKNVRRLFSNPKYDCYAEVIQTIDKPDSIFCNIGNFFEGGWVVDFMDSQQDDYMYTPYILRVPKKIMVLKNKPSLEELLKSFLDYREKLKSNLDINVINNFSIDFYCNQLQKEHKENRKILIYKSFIWMVIEIMIFTRKSNHEKEQFWMDYKRHLKSV